MAPTSESREEGGLELWLLLLLGLALPLLELARHVAATPRTFYVVVCAALTLAAAIRTRAFFGLRRRRLGLALLVGAAVSLLAGVVAGPAQVSRLSIPLGVVGLALWLGRPALPVALLAVFVVPVPRAVLVALPDFVLESLAAAAGALAQGVEVHGVVLEAGNEAGNLQLPPSYTGLPMAALGAACGWYRAVCQEPGVFPWAPALRGAAIGLLLQIAALLVGAVALPYAGTLVAQTLIEGLPLLLGATLLLFVLPGPVARRSEVA